MLPTWLEFAELIFERRHCIGLCGQPGRHDLQFFTVLPAAALLKNGFAPRYFAVFHIRRAQSTVRAPPPLLSVPLDMVARQCELDVSLVIGLARLWQL